MSTHVRPLDCDGFASRLADYLEGDAPETVRSAMDAHAAICTECSAVLEDLAIIRRDSAALPSFAPPRDLWTGIAERLDESVVVPMGAGRSLRRMPRQWMRPAAAAAALIVVTAGITHLLTRASLAPASVRSVAARPAESTAVATAAPHGVDGQFVSTSPEPAGTARASSGLVRTVANRATGQRSAARGTSALPLMDQAEPVYDHEINKLRRIVRERRSQLDPATVAVLEQSIAVIDSAIAQSRAALAKDPASGFLATQLNHSLEKKVELLRTAATLPSRT
ncbi:MAG TPA: hypothetical protein VGG78_05665 [Gemmatimonadaceae bacterium]